MKKICFLLLIAVLVCSMTACAAGTVTLHCDGENCANTVEVEYEGDNKPDEQWIIFCETCAKNVLED